MGMLVGLFLSVIAVYTGACFLAARFQRHLIYMPVRLPDEDLRGMADKIRLSSWEGMDGARRGWRMKVPGTRPLRRVLVLHGNAGNAIHRLHFVESFLCRPDGDEWEVFLMEYPGYGAREGSPGEKAFMAAAEEALGLLKKEGPEPVLVLGESIGGALACLAAGCWPERIAGLLLFTPVSDLHEVAAHHYRFFPVRRLLRERYDAVRAIGSYPGPVAMVLAERDEIVPVPLSRRLIEAHAGPHREWVVENATHNALWYSSEAAWWNGAVDFIVAEMEKRNAG
jgi:pimeloyl-ACP methyl ester carboxylesterase